MSQSSHEESYIYRTYHNVKGLTETNVNDLVVFRHTKYQANFNVIYFGGDVQDYEEYMLKSYTSKSYTKWNLINTGKVILHKFLDEVRQSSVNLIIVRPDFYHLKIFANYSNFVASNDFGSPLDADELATLNADESEPKTKAWSHLKCLVENGINLFNTDSDNYEIDPSLPIVLCGFSKGCVVLNQLCKEIQLFSNDADRAVSALRDFVKYCIWLDGGHCGSAEAWIIDEKTIESIKRLNWTCLVYTTPYQMRNKRHADEYLKFIEISKSVDVKLIKHCYFQEEFLNSGDDADFQLETHFSLLTEFDTTTIR